MPSKITNNLRVLNVNQFMNMFSTYTYPEWTSGVTYSDGDVVRYNIQKYVAVDDGNGGAGNTAGANPPTHESGIVSDDNIDWQFVEYTYNLTFFENQLYIGIGKPVAWRPFLTTPIAAFSGVAAYSEDDVVTDAGSHWQSLTDHSASATVPGSDATNWRLMDWSFTAIDDYAIGEIVEDGGAPTFYMNMTGDNTATAPASDTTNWVEIDDETPITPENDFHNMYRYLDNLISAKKVQGHEISYGIERFDWTNGAVYNAFDPKMDDFTYIDADGNALNDSAPFYVVTENLGTRRIYKCLDNAGDGTSTVEPSGESASAVRTVDGYLWQYMATVEAQDNKFVASNYVPVKFKTFDDASTQWIAQSQAEKLSLSNIKVTNAGISGYSDTDTVTITAPDLAGGTQAVATLSTTGGLIDYVSISNQGSGYLNAPTVTITSGTGDGSATFEVVMAPKDGNASNILKELNARYLIINEEFNDDEDLYFPVTAPDNEFRQIMLFVDPLNAVDATVCTEDLYLGYENPFYIEPSSVPAFAATTAYTAGDIVSNAGSNYMAKVDFTSGASFNILDWRPANMILPGSGTLLYIDNTDTVPRQAGQIEDVKIILKF